MESSLPVSSCFSPKNNKDKNTIRSSRITYISGFTWTIFTQFLLFLEFILLGKIIVFVSHNKGVPIGDGEMGSMSRGGVINGNG